MDNACFAAVRYADMKTEVLRLSSVRNFNIEAFQEGKIFKIKTSSWSKDGREEKYRGIVEGFGESKEKAEAHRKAFLKNFNPSRRQEIIKKLKQHSRAPTSDISDAPLHIVEQDEENKRDARRVAEAERSAALLSKNPCKPAVVTDGADCATVSSPEKSQPPQKIAKKRKRESDPEAVRNSRKERKEQEIAKEMAGTEWNKMIMMNKPTSANQRMNSARTENVPPISSCEGCEMKWAEQNKKLDRLEAKLDRILGLLASGASSSSSSSASHSKNVVYGKEVTNNQIELGLGVSCSVGAWQTMNVCTEVSDWCTAYLRGVLGEENAMKYRIIPRYSDLLKFSPEFLEVAKIQYHDFIERRIEELSSHLRRNPSDELAQVQKNFFCENKATLIKQIGASLSDRCDAMYRVWRKKQEAQGITLPERVKVPVQRRKAPICRTKGKKILTMPKSVHPRTVRTLQKGQKMGSGSSSSESDSEVAQISAAEIPQSSNRLETSGIISSVIASTEKVSASEDPQNGVEDICNDTPSKSRQKERTCWLVVFADHAFQSPRFCSHKKKSNIGRTSRASRSTEVPERFKVDDVSEMVNPDPSQETAVLVDD